MLHVSRSSQALPALALLAAAFALLAFAAAPTCRAQTQSDKVKEEPPFHEYKGVRIGMTTEEARKLLGNPTDKDDKQDLYSFNDNESCQVYYDATKKVFAVSVTFLGGKAIPAAKSVLGDEADAKQDGSLYKLIRFPKMGYWVSYTRTSGDSPVTIIAMQKIQ
jgi:hypothetical protein